MITLNKKHGCLKLNIQALSAECAPYEAELLFKVVIIEIPSKYIFHSSGN